MSRRSSRCTAIAACPVRFYPETIVTMTMSDTIGIATDADSKTTCHCSKSNMATHAGLEARSTRRLGSGRRRRVWSWLEPAPSQAGFQQIRSIDCASRRLLLAGSLMNLEGRYLGQWASVDPSVSQWYKSLMQPGNPTICCSGANAYYADVFETNGDHMSRSSPTRATTRHSRPALCRARHANRRAER
jgi:hypothetical protein